MGDRIELQQESLIPFAEGRRALRILASTSHIDLEICGSVDDGPWWPMGSGMLLPIEILDDLIAALRRARGAAMWRRC